MATGIITTVGRVPIPFAGYGQTAAWIRGNRRPSRPGHLRAFAGSSELVSIARQALGRYQNAIDDASAACSSRRGVDWFTGFSVIRWLASDTSTESICNAPAQMQMNFDVYSAKVSDPNTTDDQLAEIIGFVNKEIDVHDLVELADATNAVTVTGKALLRAPGTAVGWVAQGAEEIVSGIAGALPWWAYVGGAALIAVALGWKPLKGP